MPTYNSPVLWMLTWFYKTDESFAGSMELMIQDEEQICRALGFAPNTPLDGEFPVGPNRQQQLESVCGRQLDFEKFDYFIGAVAAT